MSTKSPLHTYVRARMREVFGEPNSALGRDHHWSLKPGPDRAAINVLVDSSSEKHPFIWLFDPHILNDGVLRELITSEGELDEFIQKIHERVQHAANKNSSPD